MADYYINIFVDDEKQQKLEGVGLGGEIKDIGGRRAIQVPVTVKEQKKLVKGYPSLVFDASNSCTLPANAEQTLMDIIVSAKSIDVMKVAILKLYNPLAGKDLRTKTF